MSGLLDSADYHQLAGLGKDMKLFICLVLIVLSLIVSCDASAVICCSFTVFFFFL